MSLKLECTFTIDSVSAKDIWLLLVSANSDILVPDLICDLDGDKINIHDVAGAIESKAKPYFTVECELGNYHFSPLGSYNQSFLQISGSILSFEDAERWVAPFLLVPEFLQARLYDEEYEFWQNAKDPLQYEVRNRSFDQLPMKSNGLPPPLEQLEVDTSSNPGRRIIRVGFIEAVGALMWFSPEFIKRVNLKIDELQSKSWLNIEEFSNGVLKLQIQKKVFTSSENVEGVRQNALRDLLFHTASM